jgi:hypothetical protein
MRILSTVAVVLASVLLEWATPARATQSPGEAAVSDIRKRLPDGWTCTLISELLVTHHRRFGYRHFVIDHVWRGLLEE